MKHSSRSVNATSRLTHGLLALLLLAALGGEAARGELSSRLPDFDLADQFGERLQRRNLQRYVVVLIGGDRQASEVSRLWAVEVLEHLAERPAAQQATQIVRVADLRGVPRAFEPIVNRRLRRGREVGILLDWRGDLSGPLGFQPRVANLVIVDPGGQVVHAFRLEKPDTASRQQVAAALAATLESGRAEDSVESRPLPDAGSHCLHALPKF